MDRGLVERERWLFVANHRRGQQLAERGGTWHLRLDLHWTAPGATGPRESCPDVADVADCFPRQLVGRSDGDGCLQPIHWRRVPVAATGQGPASD